jgi:hypothetical protein
MRGAVSDYAVAFSKRDLVLNTYNIDKNGDFLSTKTSININQSTVFVIGEKHIPSFALNGDTPISNMWNGGLHRTHATINAFCSSLRYINLDEVPANAVEGAVDKNGVPIVITKHPIAVTNAEVESELSFLTGNGNIRYPSTFSTGEYLWGSDSPETLNIGVLDGSVKAVSKEMDADLFNRSWLPAPPVTVFVD